MSSSGGAAPSSWGHLLLSLGATAPETLVLQVPPMLPWSECRDKNTEERLSVFLRVKSSGSLQSSEPFVELNRVQIQNTQMTV